MIYICCTHVVVESVILYTTSIPAWVFAIILPILVMNVFTYSGDESKTNHAPYFLRISQWRRTERIYSKADVVTCSMSGCIAV
jgi:hypothetical protein